jgi:poly-gamma-glutamate capsule biosynthesis protein CapA/YwtB (metallophosphatase superfamily)
MEELVLLAVGDVAPDRGADHFDRVTNALRAADITFGQLEVPLSNRGERQLFAGLGGPRWDGPLMDPAAGATVLADAGFDVMSFAGNHTMDRSEESLFDTLEATAGVGVRLVGAGRTGVEARRPVVIDRAGTRVGFLAYCSVLPPGYAAGPSKSGVAPLRARTWYEQVDWQPGTRPRIHTATDPDDLSAMIADVTRLRSEVDVLVVSVHWGVHFEPATIADYQREIGHAAVDAGADLVIGHHAHIVKGVETYRGKAIIYSLNNFVLRPRGDDGEWLSEANTPSDQQRTLVLRCVIRDGRITRVAFLPCWIDADACPELLPATDPRAEAVFDYVRWASTEAGLPVAFRREGDELVVDLP